MTREVFICSIKEAQVYVDTDLRFYSPLQLEDLTMAKVSGSPSAELYEIVTKSFKLTKLEITRLVDNSPISTNVLLALLECITDRSAKSGSIIHPAMSDAFLSSQEPFSVFKAEHFTRDFILFPIYLSGIKHWTMLFIQPKTLSLTYVDPLTLLHGQEQFVLDRMKLATSKIPKLKSKSWEYVPVKHSIQEDDYNCGLVVAHVAKELLQGTKGVVMDPDILAMSRLEFYDQDLMTRSLPRSGFCSECGQLSASSDLIVCICCLRHFHSRCAKLSASTRKFVCVACR